MREGSGGLSDSSTLSHIMSRQALSPAGIDSVTFLPILFLILPSLASFLPYR